MKELMNEINEAFIMISRIPVTGDAVDAMAVARAKLRKVHEELSRIEEAGDCCRGEVSE